MILTTETLGDLGGAVQRPRTGGRDIISVESGFAPVVILGDAARLVGYGGAASEALTVDYNLQRIKHYLTMSFA